MLIDLVLAVLRMALTRRARKPTSRSFIIDQNRFREGSSLAPASSASPWAFIGGTIRQVTVEIAGEPWVDLDKEIVGAFARN